MNKSAVFEDWIAALRSGRYKQDSGFLRTAHGFDAMGVLCDVVDPDAWSELDTTSGVTPHYVWSYKDDWSSFMLPMSLCDDLNISESFCRSLLIWNDRKELSFKDIANLLEQDWLR